MTLELDALRAKHGSLVVLRTGSRVVAFRAMNAAEALTLSERLRATPDLSYPLALDACRACLVGGEADFDALLEETPLAFDLDDGVCGHLLSAAVKAAEAAAKDGIRRWRSADRNLAAAAQNLLEFKAYQGGPASPGAMAGAINVAEGIDTLKGLFKLHLGFMKAYARRG
jgi:hypothetical protein